MTSSDGVPVGRVLAQLVEDATFGVVRFAAGYEISEVDRFLDEVVSTALSGADVRNLLVEVTFTPTRWRSGYAMEQVDDFLDELQRAAARR